MGVLGITPFLQKTCPQVFTRLADRLSSLRRKTVVIDGTLITQRLHFSPMPHPYRHIIGWHRILTELRDADVRAIAVFDGRQRSVAKAREVQRRRHARKVDAVRASIETNRFHRLEKLMRLIPYYRSLPASDRHRIRDALGTITSPLPSGLTLLPPSPRITSYPDHFFSVHSHDMQEVCPPSLSASRSEPHHMSHLDDVSPVYQSPFDDPYNVISPTLPFVRWNSAVQPTPTPYPLPHTIEAFQSELSTLYSEYSQCITQLSSIPSSLDDPEDQGAPEDGFDPMDARIEYAMSKQQLQMTFDEGYIWNLLSTPSSDLPPPETESALISLAQRSTVISRSYQRRTNTPTAQTYEECKELLRAMGVPCIESSGPFEAEALACALVAHGYADYVVSEDTDVLVYEAPMLRGITTRESPLVIVHGDAIRASLALDRDRYLDFALLLGTDFSQRIKHVGPSRALKFIREHGSIERVVATEHKYPPRVPVGEYLAQVGLARLVFQNLPPLPDAELLRPTEGDPNAVAEIIQRYRLHRALPGAWDAQSALAGNYFGDDPSMWG